MISNSPNKVSDLQLDLKVSVNDLSASLALALGPEIKEEPEDDSDENMEDKNPPHDENTSSDRLRRTIHGKKRILTRREPLFAYRTLWYIRIIYSSHIGACLKPLCAKSFWYSFHLVQPRNCCGMRQRHAFAAWFPRRRREQTCQSHLGLGMSGTRVQKKGNKWPCAYKRWTGTRWGLNIHFIYTSRAFNKVWDSNRIQPLEAMDINLSNPQDKFVDEMQRIITSRKRVSIKKDQGWYSEAEMKSDLKWSQHLGLNWKN